MNKILVWDFPTRAFHWILVFAISFSVYTGLDGGFKEMDYHMYSGYLILSLILFRIAWGFLSNGNARFSRFIVGPQKIIAYVFKTDHGDSDSNEPKSDVKNYLGHNPLGGLSILALLGILLVQTTTGLFANDEILVEGPLIHLVSEELSSQLTTIHHYSARCLGALILLHLSAIVFHELILKHKIVMPMISGIKMVINGEGDIKTKSKAIAQHREIIMALILIISAMALVYAIVTYL